MRFAQRKISTPARASRGWLRIGFVPTIDCAVLIAAQELGLFSKYGLSVKLAREVGWATIRDKLLHEELDAAATHASMAISIYCGISVIRRPCLTGLILGANGSAITLSNRLWDQGVRDAATLGRYLRNHPGARKLVFAAGLQLSSQNHDLRNWLRSGGIDPDRDVDITIIPSSLVYDTFQEGYLDGYCVAEPWNSVAVQEKTGWIAAVSSELNPGHPEKVLLVLQRFAEKREDEHLRLIAALIAASQFCDAADNRADLARMLSHSRYLDVDVATLRNSLVGPFANGHTARTVKDFVVFNALKVGAPRRALGRRIFDLVQNLSPEGVTQSMNPGVIGKVFRDDIFDEAVKIWRTASKAGSEPGGSPLVDSDAAANPEDPERDELRSGRWQDHAAQLAEPATA